METNKNKKLIKSLTEKIATAKPGDAIIFDEALTEKKTKRLSRRIPKAVRPEEFKTYSGILPKSDHIARISGLLAYGSGLRISEVLRCFKENFQGDKLFVPESKYGVERYVPVPKGWKDEFLNHLPLETTARTIQRKFKKYSKESGLPEHYTFHSLRHGFATRCLESGMPLNMVQVLLGHSNISTTSIYVKANPIDAIKNYMDNF